MRACGVVIGTKRYSLLRACGVVIFSNGSVGESTFWRRQAVLVQQPLAFRKVKCVNARGQVAQEAVCP